MVGATRVDVESALLRPLTKTEEPYVDALLSRAYRTIAAEFDIAQLEEAGLLPNVIDVQAEMVARRLRNVSGKYQESDGQYSYSLDRSIASGKLELTDDDREYLGLVPDGGFAVINPFYGGSSVVA